MKLHYLDSNKSGVWKYLTVEDDAPATPHDVADQLCSDAIRAGFDRLVLLEDDAGRVSEYFVTMAAPWYMQCSVERMGVAKAKDTGWNIQPMDILASVEVDA